MTATTQQTQAGAALAVVLAVSEAIREAGRVPSGTVYAMVMGRLTLDQYTSLIGVLTRAGLVKCVAHELIWTGPEVLSK